MAPIMFTKSLCTALAAAGVEYWVADGEADAAVAHVASQRGWLVLSNDSDFCIFDVPGFVSLSQLWPKEDRLEYTVARRSAVAHTLGLRPEWLCLLASFSGNDYISEASLVSWHTQLGVTEHRDVFLPVAAAIAQLFTQNPELTIKQAAEQLCKRVCSDSSDYEQLMIKISYSIAEYDIDSPAHATTFSNSETVTSLVLDQGRPWPCWLVALLRRGFMGGALLCATQLKWWCTPTVERLASPSVYAISSPLRRAVFTILFPTGGTATEFSRPPAETGFRGQPFPFPSAADAQLPHLEHVAELTPEQLQSVLLRVLGCAPPPAALDPGLWLGMAALVFFLRHSRTKQKVGEVEKMCTMIAVMQSVPTEAELALESCGARPSWWRMEDTAIAHHLSEWHATLACVDALNGVLGQPMGSLSPHKLFGGLAAHRVYKSANELSDPAVCELRALLIDVYTHMSGTVAGADDLQAAAECFTAGNVWEGTLVYDGDIDPSYSVLVTASPANGKAGTGDHTAFGATETVSISMYVRDGAITVAIRDDESMLCGQLDLEQRRIIGMAYSIYGKKKTLEGEFSISLG